MRILKSVVLGALAISIGGFGLAVFAAPAPFAAAYSSCNSAKVFADESGGYGIIARLPIVGSKNTECVLGQKNSSTGVTALQRNIKSFYHKRLNMAAANISIDGVFGSKTESAVKAVQNKYSLTADGVYGPKTRGKMCWIDAYTDDIWYCNAASHFDFL